MNSAPTPTTTWAPGAVVPGTVYRVIRPLGQGGMGEVYEVEHEMLGARRALKVLARHLSGREDLAERLRVEARGLARLKHVNLVEVYDLGTAADGRIFFAMELLTGATLRELLRAQGKLGPAAAVRVIGQVLDGLDIAHAAGMLHRDVKPENVFVSRDGVAKLLDFGVAKAIDASTPAQSITGVGMTVGTPRYMSPEQAEGRPIDARTDIYSVGLVLWEVLVGRPPFEETDAIALAVAKMTRGVALLEGPEAASIPGPLRSVVACACQADPSLRFSTAEAFALALRATVPSTGRRVIGAGASGTGPAALEVATTALAPITPFAHESAATAPGTAPLGDTTAVDAGVPDGFSGCDETEPMADPGLVELTQRLASQQFIDRDQPTLDSPGMEPMRGPSGTEMLPAVAARRRAAELASPSPQAVAIPIPASGPASQPLPGRAHRTSVPTLAGERSTNWKGISAGVLAFVVPVSLALVVGFTRLDSGTSTMPSTPSAVTPAIASASPRPSDTGDSLPVENVDAGAGVADSPSIDASAEPETTASASGSRPAQTIPSASARGAKTAVADAGASPARSGVPKPRTMPASGL